MKLKMPSEAHLGGGAKFGYWKKDSFRFFPLCFTFSRRGSLLICFDMESGGLILVFLYTATDLQSLVYANLDVPCLDGSQQNLLSDFDETLFLLIAEMLLSIPPVQFHFSTAFDFCVRVDGRSIIFVSLFFT
ncbi:hypothetical protein I7I48_08507 [Histoplasma ohiense]|nr:hypothetical protein I7I48_08507 [Histoplasma ohiense (nom. inval.)]